MVLEIFFWRFALQHNVIALLQNILHLTLQALSDPAWQGIGAIFGIIGVIILLVPKRKSAHKNKQRLKDEVARKLVSFPSDVPVTHLPKSIPLLISGSLVPTGTNISAEKVYIKVKPLDMFVQQMGRGNRVM